jgi:hypothetical protein
MVGMRFSWAQPLTTIVPIMPASVVPWIEQ